jgi:dihydroorotate dehydrogenase
VLEDDFDQRYGFNSHGHAVVYSRVKSYRDSSTASNHILGVNLGKNKTSKDALADYTKGLEAFAHVADYIVINISSPNTPGLRALQNKKEFESLVENVIKSYLSSSRAFLIRAKLKRSLQRRTKSVKICQSLSRYRPI